MGILVTPTAEKKIIAVGIDGLDTELLSAYLRLEFYAKAEGNTLEVVTAVYYDKEAYLKGIRLTSNLTMSTGVFQLQPLEEQSLETANTYIVNAFTEQGYTCVIV